MDEVVVGSTTDGNLAVAATLEYRPPAENIEETLFIFNNADGIVNYLETARPSKVISPLHRH
jgi:hypothetical protein